ncbi:FmdB family zinc ribbon protein [Chloroflexota bacterium]
MPIYEYVCPKCESKFELLRSLSRSEEEAPCPGCKIPACRVLSTFAAFSKGSGESSEPIGGGSSCSGCSATSCSTCH